jgi:16S rRNA U516 pseudouridylate synthase RsuA-like enzyme
VETAGQRSSMSAMQLALEALESDPMSHAGLVSRKQAITVLRQALVDADDTSQERVDEKAKREQEPVAWMHTTGTGHRYFRKKPQDKVFNPQPVFTTPPKREWVGLTINEAEDFYEKYTDKAELINAIDKFLEEKNA